MKIRTRVAGVWIVRVAVWMIALAVLAPLVLDGQEQAGAKTAQAWTLDEALAQLRLYPRDSYLQYVAMQLGRRESRLAEVTPLIDQLNRAEAREQRAARADSVDLFSVFSGASAVQESLQLDTLRGEEGPRQPDFRIPGPKTAVKNGAEEVAQAERARQERRRQRVPITDLVGPTIKSHPWEQMLAGKKPELSPLARATPEDFYFVEFKSLVKLLEAMEISDLWGTHLFNQAVQEARTQNVGERLKEQLVIETSPLLRSAYDLVVEEVAVTGSDLYVREGSDVTLLFRLKQPGVFKARMDGFLAAAEKRRADVRRTTGEYRGVAYTHLAAPERAIHVFSAYPTADLHVRSNSRVALERILDAIQGTQADGKPVRTLGQSTEFAYIRTLLPRGAQEEDGFVYLSDPFIRRLVGPQVKLTERRRLLCYNHLRMIGHAALMYRTERGKPATSLEELAKAGCAPGLFGQGPLTCPDGGKYRLAEDGLTAVCSHHGHAHALTPCCEIPVREVSGTEADEYKAFLEEYNRYWRTFFDPIALRIQITPQRYRIETIVLPLIDNSMYSGLASALGGKPERLDALPVPARNIFSVAARLDKAALLREFGMDELLTKEEKEEPKPTGKQDAAKSAANLQQIAIAMHNHHGDFNRLPAAAIMSKDKKPLLSLRVALLPYLEQDNLYHQFKMDEPWDSEHNKKLLEKMPAVYRRPGAKPDKENKTPYLVPVGADAVFSPDWKALTLGQLSVQDGTSNTIFLVEADDEKAVPWTKPEDWSFDPRKPRQGLGKNYADGFLVAFADGSASFLRNTVDEKKLAASFTRNGGEPVSVRPTDEIALRIPRTAAASPGIGLSGEELQRLKLGEFLAKGIGNQVGMHVYDAVPLFDFSLPEALGMALGNFNGGGRGLDDGALAITFLIAALNAPVYVSVPVKDAKVVDEFLTRLDEFLAVLARQRERFGGFLSLEQDFYQLPLGQHKNIRSYSMRFGPLKWRFFWGRIGNGLYLASKPFILEDLLALEAERNPALNPAADGGPEAHAMIRIRPQNWNQVLSDYRLGWAENNRCACLHNLGPLGNLARALPAGRSAPESQEHLRAIAGKVYGAHFFCPEEGRYAVSADGKAVTCSVHGSALQPRQSTAPVENSALGKLLGGFRGLTVSLTFLEDGLHTVVTIDRK